MTCPLPSSPDVCTLTLPVYGTVKDGLDTHTRKNKPFFQGQSHKSYNTIWEKTVPSHLVVTPQAWPVCPPPKKKMTRTISQILCRTFQPNSSFVGQVLQRTLKEWLKIIPELDVDLAHRDQK